MIELLIRYHVDMVLEALSGELVVQDFAEITGADLVCLSHPFGVFQRAGGRCSTSRTSSTAYDHLEFCL